MENIETLWQDHSFYSIKEKESLINKVQFAKALMKFYNSISLPVEAEVKPDACGQKLLKAMLELKYNPDKDMIPTVKRIETSNGGMTTYLRYDVVVKYCNKNFISKHSV